MDNYQPRRKGFSFLSFLLGFLIGIIFLVGAIAGVVFYALNAKIDDVLGVVGVDNGKDENGKNQIINTDAENGGAETLLQLFTKVAALAGDTQNLSVGEVENLIPAVGGLVDGFHGMLNSYLAVEREELVAVKFSEFGEYVSGKLLDIEPAALMENFGMGSMLENKIVSLMLVGKEASYVEAGTEKYPVYYDEYSLVGGSYLRESDGAILSQEYGEYLYEKNGNYRVNYYIVDEAAFVTDENCSYFGADARSVNILYLPYTPEYATLSGNYYYKNGEMVKENPVTLGTLSDGGFGALDEIYLTELIASDDELMTKIFGDVTLGDVMNGNVNVGDIINDLTVGDLIDPAGNKLLNALKDVKLSEMSEAINELTLEEIMDISPNDKILSQIKDATIATLPAKIGGITVNAMFAEEIYAVKDKDGNVTVPATLSVATEYVSDYLYYGADGELVNVGDELGKLTKAQFDAGEYYTYGQAQGEWKILLYTDDAGEKAYTVNNMSEMIANVSGNMQKSSLQELSDAGILKFPEGSLEHTVNGRALGTMTILDAINIVAALPST